MVAAGTVSSTAVTALGTNAADSTAVGAFGVQGTEAAGSAAAGAFGHPPEVADDTVAGTSHGTAMSAYDGNRSPIAALNTRAADNAAVGAFSLAWLFTRHFLY